MFEAIKEEDQKEPHTRRANQRNKLVYTLISVLIYGRSGTSLPALMEECVSSDSLTPWWLLSVPDWRSQRRAEGLPIHPSP